MRLLPLLFIVGVGCDDSFEPRSDPTDTDTSDGCPEGLLRASDASFVLTEFSVNGGALASNFNPDTLYDGIPAACTNADASAFQLVFEVGGAAYARITMEHSGPATYDANGSEATVILDLFGADIPTVYTAGDWLSASWNVATEDFAVTSNFFGEGFVSSERVTIGAQLAVTP